MKHCILVELDALLDTRLGTVAGLNPDGALTLVKSPEYYRRQLDDFQSLIGLPKADFDAAYRARDLETLKRSRLTGITPFLDTWVRELEGLERSSPHVENVEVHINIAPYEMDEEERTTLLTTVMARIGRETAAKIVNIPLSELTPTHCRREYTGMVLYNFREWMELQAEAFMTVKAPQMVVTAPTLYRDHLPTDTEIGEMQVEGMGYLSPFTITQMLFSEMFSLELIPTKIFSVLRF